MNNIFLRTEALLGTKAMEKLQNSKVLLFGLGGVGGHVAEALVRSGIGEITLVDKDSFDETNLNRQIFATVDMIGKSKTKVEKERLLKINPKCKIETFDMFYLPETAPEIDFSGYNYIIDAIDTVAGKIQIIMNKLQVNFLKSAVRIFV